MAKKESYETLEQVIIREWGKRGLQVLKISFEARDGKLEWVVEAKEDNEFSKRKEGGQPK